MASIAENNYQDISDNLFTDKIWMNIFQYIPLKKRINTFSLVSRAMRDLARRSVKEVAFYKEDMDYLDDNRLNLFLRQYGYYLKHINLDLFKATLCTSQGNWRQTVLNITSIGKNITSLDVLVCDRHKLRDTDVMKIFKFCNKLQMIRVDAQFLTGYCFANAPKTIQHLELDMCFRFSADALTKLLNLKRLKTLHMSQMLVLNDDLVGKMVQRLNYLETLSIVSNVDSKYENLTTEGMAELAYLPRLSSFNVEGFDIINDNFLKLVVDDKYSFKERIERLSIAFCNKITSTGIGYLAKCNNLTALNLDGISKNDISEGLVTASAHGGWEKLFVADGTNYSIDSLIQVVNNSKGLRFLDISNYKDMKGCNYVERFSELFRNVEFLKNRPPMIILTENAEPWTAIPQIDGDGFDSPPKLRIYSLFTDCIYKDKIAPHSVVNGDAVTQISPGYFEPDLRIGNRYRTLWAYIGPNASPKIATTISNNNVRNHQENTGTPKNAIMNRNNTYHRNPTRYSNNSTNNINFGRKPFANNRGGRQDFNSGRFVQEHQFRHLKSYGDSGDEYISKGNNHYEMKNHQYSSQRQIQPAYNQQSSQQQNGHPFWRKNNSNYSTGRGNNIFEEKVNTTNFTSTPHLQRNYEEFNFQPKFEQSPIPPVSSCNNDRHNDENNLLNCSQSSTSAMNDCFRSFENNNPKLDYSSFSPFKPFNDSFNGSSNKDRLTNFGFTFGSETPPESSPFRQFTFDNSDSNFSSMNLF
uniref:F-box domain-containing protein n=1 Tax=Parastrongyloides trichosuri TaxID=131310 RepID=A0A0N4ZY68_PARTI